MVNKYFITCNKPTYYRGRVYLKTSYIQDFFKSYFNIEICNLNLTILRNKIGTIQLINDNNFFYRLVNNTQFYFILSFFFLHNTSNNM